jgi:chromosome partitioning protein
MQRIALINPYPGVGKTTISASLGHAFALAGHRVTVIDLDPTGQLAAAYGIFRAPTKGVDRVLLNGTPLASVSIGARDLLTLIPAGAGLHLTEEKPENGATRALTLMRATEGQCTNQAFVIFDCPASGGQLVANAIFAADMIMLPVNAEKASLNGAMKALLMLKRFEPYLNKKTRSCLLSNRVVPRSTAGKVMREKLVNYFPELLLRTQIPESTAIIECSTIGRTIFEYRAASPAAKAFRQLAEELLSHPS